MTTDPAAVPTITKREFSLIPEAQQDRFVVYVLASMVRIIDDTPPKGSP
jgi:hypothetical protein